MGENLLEGYRVLVVEDYLDNANLLERVLESEGSLVDKCYGKNGALQKVFEAINAGTPYNCILMDICLPGYDGIDIAKSLIQTYPNTNLVIIACTSLDMEPRLKAAIELNILTAYIPKPINPDTICKTLLGYLKK